MDDNTEIEVKEEIVNDEPEVAEQSEADDAPVDADPEEADEALSDEPVVKKKSKPKSHNPYKTQLNRVQKEKYRAINEAQRLAMENEQLRQMMESTNKTAMYHYDNAVENRVKQAEIMQANAIESGDVQGQVASARELADAVAERRRVLESKAIQQEQYERQQYQAQQPPAYVPPEMDEYQHREAKKWVARNPWMDPKNQDHNPELLEELTSYADRVERILVNSGQDYLIGTPRYYQELDNYVSSYYEDSTPQPQQNRSLNMRPTQGYVAAPTRGRTQSEVPTAAAGSNAPINGVPASAIRDMAKRLGVSESAYRAQMIKDQKARQGRQ